MKLNQRHFTELCIVLFVLFLATFDYPFISRLVNERNIEGVVIDSMNSQQNVSPDNREKEIQKAKDYNQSLADGLGDIDATFGKEGMNELYRSLLNFDSSGVIGIIEIPAINVKLPIYHGTSENVLQKGAGHVEGSSLPIGGKSTHSCISAHRGLPNKKMFTRLDELKIGDIFLIHVLNETHAYQIEKIEIVEPTQIESLKIQSNKDKTTLITCTPYGINSHRMYVTGERVDYQPEIEEDIYQFSFINWFKEWWWIIINVILIIIMCTLLVQINIKTKKRRMTNET